MIRRLIVLAMLAALAFGEEAATYLNFSTVSVTNSSYTAVTSPLHKANYIQVFIQAGSTAQNFSVRLPGCAAAGCTLIVPNGSAFTFQAKGLFATTDTLFSVQTASSSATLQVVAMRTN